MSYQKHLISLLSLSLVSQAVLAENSDPEKLDNLLVTVTRTDIAQHEALSAVSVITREDIEKYQYQTLAEAIQGLPGVVISNSGGMGKQTSLFLRGTESNHTHILLNGSKLATNEFGAPQLEYIPIDTIERIELVRGPQSGLYGSSAIGGTIQIFTRQATDGITPYGSLSYGSHQTKQGTIGLNAANANAWINVSAGYTTTDGFDSCDGRSASLFIGCYVDEPDRDGYDNRNNSIRAGFHVTDKTNIEVFSLYSDGNTQYDGYYNETDFTQHTYGLQFDSALTQAWQVKVNLSQAKLDTDNYGSAFSSADNDKDMLSFQNDIQLSEHHLLTLGYDYEQDEYRSITSSTFAERENHGVFSQLQGENDMLDYRLTYRHDDNEQYGNYNSVNAAIGTDINHSLRTYLSYGEAFTAPSFIDLDPAAYGNPELKAEESKSIEVGFTGHHVGVDWSVAVYRTSIDNLIALDSFWVPQNIAEATIKGMELTAATEWQTIQWHAQLSLLDPENTSQDANHGNVLARRAEQTLTLSADKQWNAYSLAAKLYYSGRRYDDAANTRRLAAYTTVDIVAGYQLSKAIDIKLKLANLFDKQYETVSGYHTDDTNLLLSVYYHP